MSQSKKITLSIVLLAVGVIAYLGIDSNAMGTSVVNSGNKEYFQDSNGDFWVNQKQHDSYQDEGYYKAPDGSYWKNEYRYLESKR